MLALQYSKSVPRYVWVRLLAGRSPRLVTGPGAFLRLAQIPPPELPSQSWVRVRPSLSGICGSDVAAVTGKSSIYLSAFTSFPFVPGHEVVGQVVETGREVTSVKTGDRVVLEPALGCTVRGFRDVCRPCTEGHYSNCERVTEGDISAGIQIGYCRDTGGGWGSYLVAHESQLYHVPDGISDEAAVLTEPLSCALHGVLGAQVLEQARVLVVGGGTIGLLTVAALRYLVPTCTIVAIARHPHQQKMAGELGGSHVVTPGPDLYDQMSGLTGAVVHSIPLGKPAVMGGFDVTFECTGSSDGLEDAVRWTRSQGQVVLTGMPHPNTIDLTPMWYKELSVTGAYTYSVEQGIEGETRTFRIALDMLSGDWGERLAALVRHRFSIKQHRNAIEAAMRPGRSGSIKTVFEPAEEV